MPLPNGNLSATFIIRTDQYPAGFEQNVFIQDGFMVEGSNGIWSAPKLCVPMDQVPALITWLQRLGIPEGEL